MFSETNNNCTSSAIEHYSLQIERCIRSKHLKLGKLLHSHLVKTSLNLNTFLANRLVDMYARCGSIEFARSAFDDVLVKNAHSWNTLLSAYSRTGRFDTAHCLLSEMPDPNVVSYNSMISGLTHYGHHRDALNIFQRMQREYGLGIVVDKFTIVGVVGACAGTADLKSLRQVHAAAILIGLELNQIMYNTLIDAYGKCRDAVSSRLLFDRMATRDVVSWTSLVGAYVCTSRLEDAHRVFDGMPVRNAVSWTTLITGYAQNGHGEVALELFERMMREGFDPTPFTLVSVLSACTSIALIGRGKQLHGYILRRSIGSELYPNVFVHNALIDMYAKCGDMGSAKALFERMSERDIVSWNSLVTGFAQNGHGKQSLAIFEKMIRSGIRPNHVTFLGVLSACSHAGLVSEGRQYLESMEKEYGLRPKPEHHAAFIDLLGRSRQLEEATELMESLPNEDGFDSVGTWGALLGACRVHGNLDLARRAAESLFMLEPSNGARYVMLSNIYAAAGRWEDARRVRRLMKEKGLKKEPACSWVEVGNARHAFVAEDKSHCQTEEIYQTLTKLAGQIKESRCHHPLYN